MNFIIFRSFVGDRKGERKNRRVGSGRGRTHAGGKKATAIQTEIAARSSDAAGPHLRGTETDWLHGSGCSGDGASRRCIGRPSIRHQRVTGLNSVLKV